MLELVHAELNKKAISDIVVTVFLILIIVFGVIIFWTSTKKLIQKSPEVEIECINLISSFSVKRACYLNEEVLIEIKRGFDDISIDKMRFAFYSKEKSSIWEITGKKCSDIRIGEDYGGYCEIISQGQTISYVFDMSGLEKQEKVKLGVGLKGKLCSVWEIKIEDAC